MYPTANSLKGYLEAALYVGGGSQGADFYMPIAVPSNLSLIILLSEENPFLIITQKRLFHIKNGSPRHSQKSELLGSNDISRKERSKERRKVESNYLDLDINYLVFFFALLDGI